MDFSTKPLMLKVRYLGIQVSDPVERRTDCGCLSWLYKLIWSTILL